jgi:hypothetical protein
VPILHVQWLGLLPGSAFMQDASKDVFMPINADDKTVDLMD